MPHRIARLLFILSLWWLWKRRSSPSVATSQETSEETREKHKIEPDQVDMDDFYSNRWLHELLKSKPRVPSSFTCNKRPRDWHKEPFLIFAEDKWFKENMTTSDFVSMKRCKQPWRYTQNIWEADAVIIEMHVYGNSLPTNPKRYCPGQLLVLRSMESVWNYPALEIAKSELGYDIVSDYRLDSDVPLSYVTTGPWLNSSPPHRVQFAATINSPYPLAAAFISNCKSHMERNKIIQKLSSLLGKDKIHFFGKCWNNAKIPSHLLTVPKEKQKTEVMKRYKFALVFENSVERDYVTEKLYDAYAANTLPIYFGDKEVQERGLIPNKTSLIHVKDYTVEALAKLMQSLDKDWNAYVKYFEWKRWPKDPKWTANLALKESRVHDTCHLAQIGAHSFTSV